MKTLKQPLPAGREAPALQQDPISAAAAAMTTAKQARRDELWRIAAALAKGENVSAERIADVLDAAGAGPDDLRQAVADLRRLGELRQRASTRDAMREAYRTAVTVQQAADAAWAAAVKARREEYEALDRTTRQALSAWNIASEAAREAEALDRRIRERRDPEAAEQDLAARISRKRLDAERTNLRAARAEAERALAFAERPAPTDGEDVREERVNHAQSRLRDIDARLAEIEETEQEVAR